MKLRQGQLWKQGGSYLRIVQLERLEVGYKALSHPTGKEGTAHRVSKKAFCRLVRGAELLTPDSKCLKPPAASPLPTPKP